MTGCGAAAPPRSRGPRAVADKQAIAKASGQGRKRRPGEDKPNLQVTYITSWPERRVFLLRACNKTQIANPSGGCLHADYSTQRDYSGPIGLQPTAIDLIMKARP